MQVMLLERGKNLKLQNMKIRCKVSHPGEGETKPSDMKYANPVFGFSSAHLDIEESC